MMTQDDTGAVTDTPEMPQAPQIDGDPPPAKKPRAPRKPKSKVAPKRKPAAKAKAKKAPRKASKKTAKKTSAKKRAPRVAEGSKKYGAAIRKARLAKKLSQRELAGKMKCKQPTICNIETGRMAAGPRLQAKIQKALGVKC